MKYFLATALFGAICTAFISASLEITIESPADRLSKVMDGAGLLTNQGYASTRDDVEVVMHQDASSYIEHLKRVTPERCDLAHQYLSSAALSYRGAPLNDLTRDSLNSTINDLCD